MSKWGSEEKETLEAINRAGFQGYILNIAAGDGRFNNELLKLSDRLLAIDINEQDLQFLKKDCLIGQEKKLYTKKVDITQPFPFDDETFDGIFCTGTLHLFNEDTIRNILTEINRVLRENGVIVLDFATDILRLNADGNNVVFDGEGHYDTQQALELFKSSLAKFDINIEISSFKEENLGSNVRYNVISGNFLIISGKKVKH